MKKNITTDGKIREAIVDGIFYPEEEGALQAKIEELLNNCETRNSDAFAVISPHAGYNYAGKCIASAFKSAVKRKLKNVVILAPLHNNPVDQIILPESKYFLTPLGSIKVNQGIVEELLSSSNDIVLDDIPHLSEHCIEVQLPFIRYLFPEAEIIPILMGSPSEKNISVLSNALKSAFSGLYEETLFIATANLTSYIDGNGAEREAEHLISLIESNDPEGIKNGITSKEISSCGAGCIATLLHFRNREYNIRVLKRGSSSDANKDPSKVVYYASIALYAD